MNKYTIAGLIILFCTLIGGNVYADKPLLEYGNTQIFGEAINYQDGYTPKGNSLREYDTYLSLTRTCVTGYLNFSDTSRIRASLDTYGFDKSSDGFYNSRWAFFSFLYWEGIDLLGPGTSVKLGLFGTPWPNWEDKIWGYRVICSSILSSQGITNPQDRGVGIDGKLTDALEYAIAFVGGYGIYSPDVDGVVNTEARLTYTLTDAIKVSLGGGTGSRAIDYGVPDYYSYTAKYGVANINYKTKPLTLSYTVGGTDKVDEDFTVNRNLYRFTGETAGKFSSTIAVWNFVDTYDLIGRLDTVDPDIAMDDDVTQKSIVGLGYRSGDLLKFVVTQQADLSAASNTAYHKCVFNTELKF